mmetsp:Transcript_26874/g.62853  ORF Transcript_26874/g.62853 Transcript_26874/m.62853 type:complete len:257 (-) Transcript_26874:150-920(-)
MALYFSARPSRCRVAHGNAWACSGSSGSSSGVGGTMGASTMRLPIRAVPLVSSITLKWNGLRMTGTRSPLNMACLFHRSTVLPFSVIAESHSIMSASPYRSFPPMLNCNVPTPPWPMLRLTNRTPSLSNTGSIRWWNVICLFCWNWLPWPAAAECPPSTAYQSSLVMRAWSSLRTRPSNATCDNVAMPSGSSLLGTSAATPSAAMILGPHCLARSAFSSSVNVVPSALFNGEPYSAYIPSCTRSTNPRASRMNSLT